MAKNKEKLTAIEAEEYMVIDMQVLLNESMLHTGVKRRELAKRMGVKKKVVNSMFSDDAKALTIRNLAKALHALGDEPSFTTDISRKLARQRKAAFKRHENGKAV